MSRDTPDIINHYETPSCCGCDCDQFSTPSPPPPFRDDPPSYNEATSSSSSSSGDVHSQSDVRSIITPPPITTTSGSSLPAQKKLSVTLIPRIKQCFPYTTFKNEVDPDHPSESFTTKWVTAVAGVDLILFAASIILAIATEKCLCYDGPIRLDFDIVMNQTSSSELDDITEKLTVYEYLKDVVLKELIVDSPPIYHIVVISLLALGMSYFVLEIWLFCVLIKIGQSRRISFCLKWICWRSVLVCLIVLVSLFDMMHAHQATCSELILGPFQIVRMIVGSIPVTWVIWNSLGSSRARYLHR